MIKGNLEKPRVMNVIKDIGIVEGWIASDSKLKGIDLSLDEKLIAHPEYGIERKDVYRDNPYIEGSGQSGFRHFLKTIDIPDGKHLLEIRGTNIANEAIWFKGEVVVDNASLNISDRNRLRLFENYSEKKTILDNMPVHLFIEPSNLCNLECVMCRSKEYIDLLKGGQKIGTMNWDVFERIEHLFPNIVHFKIAGWGEPYTNYRFPEMISRIRKYNKEAQIGFNTNAVLLNEERIINLIENRVSSITVSIDSPYRENYEMIRKKASYDRLINNLQMILELKEKYSSEYPRMGFEYVVMNQNVLDMPEFVKFAARFRVPSVIFVNVGFIYSKFEHVRFTEHGKYLDTYKRTKEYAGKLGVMLTGNAIESFEAALNNEQDTNQVSKKEIRENPGSLSRHTEGMTGNSKSSEILCMEPFQTSYICFDGNILPCCVVGGQKYIGNVLDNNFEDIWNNDIYVSLREDFIEGNFNESSFCKRCRVCLQDSLRKQEYGF